MISSFVAFFLVIISKISMNIRLTMIVSLGKIIMYLFSEWCPSIHCFSLVKRKDTQTFVGGDLCLPSFHHCFCFKVQIGSILKAGLHLGPDCGLGAICPVSMETTYQLENQATRRKSPRALHHLKEYPNYLCNRIESYILLCLLGYDHKPIDNCPLLTT